MAFSFFFLKTYLNFNEVHARDTIILGSLLEHVPKRLLRIMNDIIKRVIQAIPGIMNKLKLIKI